jgi:hypothetical protein
MTTPNANLNDILAALSATAAAQPDSDLRSADSQAYRSAYLALQRLAAADEVVRAEARARAEEIGVPPATVDNFAAMDRPTLLLQAALWFNACNVQMRHGADQVQGYDAVLAEFFELCREKGVEIPDPLMDSVMALADRPVRAL